MITGSGSLINLFQLLFLFSRDNEESGISDVAFMLAVYRSSAAQSCALIISPTDAYPESGSFAPDTAIVVLFTVRFIAVVLLVRPLVEYMTIPASARLSRFFDEGSSKRLVASPPFRILSPSHSKEVGRDPNPGWTRQMMQQVPTRKRA
jgi:hypothetical protein